MHKLIIPPEAQQYKRQTLILFLFLRCWIPLIFHVMKSPQRRVLLRAECKVMRVVIILVEIYPLDSVARRGDGRRQLAGAHADAAGRLPPGACSTFTCSFCSNVDR